MCNPTAIAAVSAVLSGAGGLFNQSTGDKAIRAQNRENEEAVRVSQQAAEAERVRQRRLEEESTASLNRALAGTAETAAGSGQEAETTAALNEANAQVTPDLTISALPGQISGDTELAKIIAGEINQSSQRVGTQVKGLNTLAGLQSAFGGLGDLFSGTGSAIQSTNLNRRASLDVSGLETGIPAARVTPGSSLFGDLLTLAGQGIGVAGGGLGSAGKAGAPASKTKGFVESTGPGILPF